MPKRTDITSILIIGAGPIVIGQACEFDYSGAQACKALRSEGYRVILVNSNPATIMTDPGLADATYIEPITPEIVERIIAREKPDALLATMGGQTALNTAMKLAASGALARHGVELIGAKSEVIDRAEDRLKFRDAMAAIGIESPRSHIAHSLEEARAALADVGLPAVIRPSFTLGGTGGGIAYNREEFEQIVGSGLEASPTNEVLVEESVLGWKEYEMEVVRDRADNCIIVCAIENVDPMGIHTGDSVTVAPALTLTDREYQRMRDASIACLRAIGVETGGSNVQFALNPADGRMLVIEMNPRVSRSSALASKATGFPIAKIAAKLAVGYTLDELANDITRTTPASFEPTIDYVVVKIPRFTFEKFPGTPALLTTSMKSVGEGMAIGRSFAEALQKGLRSMETGLSGLDPIEPPGDGGPDAFRAALSEPKPDRLLMVARRPAGGRHLCREPLRSLVRARIAAHRGGRKIGAGERPARRGRRAPPAQGAGLFRRAPGPAQLSRRARGAGVARTRGRGTGLPPHRHLRRRIRLRHAVYVFNVRRRLRHAGLRSRPDRPRKNHHSRRRPEPHRPGHRVRLLLRPRRLCAQGSRLRDHHGQLQSRNRQHRLRHLRPPVFRAADRRGRDRHRPPRAGARQRARLHRAVWRADAA
jgi:carbamoylphosphate synthase large subunit